MKALFAKKEVFMSNKNKTKTFVRHFRIYFRNGHPAYIVDEEGNKYVFHRVTHSKTSGGKKNWEKKNNPILGDDRPMMIVKKEEKDNKGRFSLFKIDLKPDADVSYPEIKRAGGSQDEQLDSNVNNITTSITIKTNNKKENNK